jgi:membrane-bound lytic murein transglycosylase D
MFSELARVRVVTTMLAASGALLFSAGCNHDQASKAHSPAPQTLSEPVTPAEPSAPTEAVPSNTGTYDYSAMRPGDSAPLSAGPVVSAPVVSAAVAPASGGGKYHTLAKGETLYAVARQYNISPKVLIAANHFADPNKLKVGEKVYIPN